VHVVRLQRSRDGRQAGQPVPAPPPLLATTLRARQDSPAKLQATPPRRWRTMTAGHHRTVAVSNPSGAAYVAEVTVSRWHPAMAGLAVLPTAACALGDASVLPPDSKRTAVGGRRLVPRRLMRRFRIHAGRPHLDSPVAEPVLAGGLIGKGDPAARLEAAVPLRYDHREMSPAPSRGLGGIDHAPPAVITPLADGSLAQHAFSMLCPQPGPPSPSSRSRELRP
jgi:hypothetical protein